MRATTVAAAATRTCGKYLGTSSSLLVAGNSKGCSTRRSMGTWSKVRPLRIKLITMDVTGTIVSFRGSLEDHYVGSAEKSGVDREQLAQLTPKIVSDAFNRAYTECSNLHPCFGGSELSAKEWWKICVAKSFAHAGVQMKNDHQREQVFQRIYSTFGSHAAYESFADAKPFLSWANRHGLVTGVLSNADERYGDSILPMLDITLDEVQFNCFSKDYKMEKPDSRFFHAAVQAAIPWLVAQQGKNTQQQYLNRSMSSSRSSGAKVGEMDTDKICHPSEVLHIGNDFVKDFEGARRAGMHCVLLDRYGEDEKAAEWRRRGAPVLHDLLDVVEFLGRSNCRLG